MKDICPNVEFVVCPDVRKACEDADVVTTCAPILEKPNRIITADMLKKDVFCMTSDYVSTFDAEVVNKGSAFVCDNRNQYLWTQELVSISRTDIRLPMRYTPTWARS